MTELASYHVGGLISGTDVQSLVDNMLKARRYPITNWETEQDEIDADISAWSDVSTDMTALTDSLDTLRGWDIWNKMTAASSDESTVTATATSSAIEATYSIAISQLAQAHSVASRQASALTPGGTSTTDLIAAGVLTAGNQFTIEGQTFTIGADEYGVTCGGTESMSTLQSKINTAATSMSSANRVIASILDNRLVITRVNTGSTDITMSNALGTPLQALHIFDGGGAYENELVAAQDASFTVNGASVTRSSNTDLTDVIQYVSLNLLQTTGVGETVTLNVEKDRTSAKDAIQDFVDNYNAVSKKLTDYGKVTLIGDNPTGATLDQVGELQNDSLVRSILYNIRKEVGESKYPYLNPVNASYTYNGSTEYMDSLQDIGVWTSSRDNQISVTDETRLDYMLNNNFDKVEQLFRGVYDATAGYQHGVAADFYAYSNAVTESITGDIDRHTSTLQDRYDGLGTDITNLEADLAEWEQELWQEFSAMEDTIASLQSGMTYLTSQLGLK